MGQCARLLGNLKFSELAYLPFIAPLYGAGAVLVRETARRAGRGPAAMLVLGLAYGLVEEGLVDQMLFNQSYFTGQEGLSRSTPRPRARPWLKAPGLMLVAVIFTVGSAWLCYTVYQETGFFASVPQLLGTSVVAVALVVAALTGMRRGSAAGA